MILSRQRLWLVGLVDSLCLQPFYTLPLFHQVISLGSTDLLLSTMLIRNYAILAVHNCLSEAFCFFLLLSIPWLAFGNTILMKNEPNLIRNFAFLALYSCLAEVLVLFFRNYGFILHESISKGHPSYCRWPLAILSCKMNPC